MTLCWVMGSSGPIDGVIEMHAKRAPSVAAPGASIITEMKVPGLTGAGARSEAADVLSCAYVGLGLSGSPAIGIAGEDFGWKALLPNWIWPLTISVASRPFVTVPFVN